MNARNAPDNHQVFIGNLPSGISNAEVHDVFGSKKIILCLPSTKNTHSSDNKHNERFFEKNEDFVLHFVFVLLMLLIV